MLPTGYSATWLLKLLQESLVGLQSLLGLNSWYGKFLPNFATMVDPMRALLRETTDCVRLRPGWCADPTTPRWDWTHCSIHISESHYSRKKIFNSGRRGSGMRVGGRKMQVVSLGMALHSKDWSSGTDHVACHQRNLSGRHESGTVVSSTAPLHLWCRVQTRITEPSCRLFVASATPHSYSCSGGTWDGGICTTNSICKWLYLILCTMPWTHPVTCSDWKGQAQMQKRYRSCSDIILPDPSWTLCKPLVTKTLIKAK